MNQGRAGIFVWTIKQFILLLLAAKCIKGLNTSRSDGSTRHMLDEYIDMLIDSELSKGRTIAPTCRGQMNSGGISHWNRPLVGIQISHIPKTGVTSFKEELKNLLHAPETYVSQEKCFDSARLPDHKVIVFFRSPISHTFSLYAHCRHRNIHDTSKAFVDSEFPRYGELHDDYVSWLSHYNNLSEREVGISHDFNCYDPRDFETRFLSCNGSFGGTERYPHHAHYPPPDLQHALRSLHQVDFLGLTDFYLESVCMFEAALQGKLSHRCSCGESKERSMNNFIQKDYGNEHMDYKELMSLVEIERNLTRLDQQLFPSALLRFLCDIRATEQLLQAIHPLDSSQHRLLCSTDKLKLKLDTNFAYMRLVS